MNRTVLNREPSFSEPWFGNLGLLENAIVDHTNDKLMYDPNKLLRRRVAQDTCTICACAMANWSVPTQMPNTWGPAVCYRPPQNFRPPQTPAEQKHLDFSCIFFEFFAKNTIFEVTGPRGFVCTGRELRGPDFDQFHEFFLCFYLFHQNMSQTKL